jgi:hypothetical protein
MPTIVAVHVSECPGIDHFRRALQISLAERKTRMRQAQAEAKREIDEYKAMREAKLRAVQPEVRHCALRWVYSCSLQEQHKRFAVCIRSGSLLTVRFLCRHKH